MPMTIDTEALEGVLSDAAEVGRRYELRPLREIPAQYLAARPGKLLPVQGE